MMPETSLSEVEMSQINKILKTISDSEWNNYLSDLDIDQERSEFNVARWAGEELFQSRDIFYRYTEGYKFDQGVGKGVWIDDLKIEGPPIE